MDCEFYFNFENGSIPQDDFAGHIKNCDLCKARVEQDEKLMTLAGSLKQPVIDGGLWAKIENELVAAKNRSDKQKPKSTGYQNLLFRIAAILILGVSVGLYLVSDREVPDKGILEASALENVNKTEQDYEKAIEKLEQLASTELSKCDLNLQLLYRDKLETIDNQILACRDALESNPANAHIRRYLFMALQDKKETLQEIISMPVNLDNKDS